MAHLWRFVSSDFPFLGHEGTHTKNWHQTAAGQPKSIASPLNKVNSPNAVKENMHLADIS